MGSMFGGSGGSSGLSQAGNAIGGIYGGGSLYGSIFQSATNQAGLLNQYSAQNPYAPQYLQDQVNNQANLYAQQQALGNQLQQMSQGKGPNPAQTQYQQNVQQNIAGAQGLISSQRGLNPALATRMGANAGTAANQQGAMNSAVLQQQQQLGATQMLGGLYGQMQNSNLGGQQLYNQGYLGAQGINAEVAAGNQKTRGGIFGGLMQGVGSAMGMARGGEVPSMIGGALPSVPGADGMGGPLSYVGKLLKGAGVQQMATGGAVNMLGGGSIPGNAQVAGDSYKNDVVPIMASPKEIMLPRSVTQAQDAPEKAKQFVSAILAKQHLRGRK